MSYTYNSSVGNAASGNTLSLSPPTGALIVVFSETSSGGGTPTVTFSDNAGSIWANAMNNYVGSVAHYCIGYCLSALAGVNTITATFNGGTPGTVNMVGAAYTGMTSPSFVATSNTANEQTNPGTGTGAIVTPSVACGSTPALLVGLTVETADHTNISAAGGATLRYLNDPNAQGLCLIDATTEKTGSQTLAWTSTNGAADSFQSWAAAFADNSAAPTPPFTPFTQTQFFVSDLIIQQ
jgi:hypothetical protein